MHVTDPKDFLAKRELRCGTDELRRGEGTVAIPETVQERR